MSTTESLSNSSPLRTNDRMTKTLRILMAKHYCTRWPGCACRHFEVSPCYQLSYNHPSLKKGDQQPSSQHSQFAVLFAVLGTTRRWQTTNSTIPSIAWQQEEH